MKCEKAIKKLEDSTLSGKDVLAISEHAKRCHACNFVLKSWLQAPDNIDNQNILKIIKDVRDVLDEFFE